jgi:hypothetical protein
VARVRWTFANANLKPGHVVNTNATNNIAISELQQRPGLLLHGTWYATNGHVIPTSDHAVLHANAANDAVLSARIIRYDRLHSYRAAPGLLADFAVFAITSRTGVRTPSGDIISHPPLSSVPYTILEGAATPDTPPQLDPEDMRQVTTRSGAQVWIIPGKRGICIATVERSHLPDGTLSGGASGCNANLAEAESEGIGFTSGHVGGVRTIIYRIVPKSIPSITIRTSSGTRKTIRLPDGIYVGPSGP